MEGLGVGVSGAVGLGVAVGVGAGVVGGGVSILSEYSWRAVGEP